MHRCLHNDDGNDNRCTAVLIMMMAMITDAQFILIMLTKWTYYVKHLRAVFSGYVHSTNINIIIIIIDLNIKSL